LNGTSSAGKTTLARELQGLLTDSYLHVEADTFSRMMPHGRYDAATFLATRCAMNSFVAVLAASGLNSVVDTLLTTRTWLKDCVDKLAEYRVMFVGVLCPPDELERRERARGDRRIGQGLDQLPFVHAHRLYDIEIDTSQASPRTCAERILHRLETGPPPAALRQLRDSPFLHDEEAYGWVLMLGSEGAGVRRLQNDLRSLGFDPGLTDGRFGWRTEAAVNSLQAANGLQQDGVVLAPYCYRVDPGLAAVGCRPLLLFRSRPSDGIVPLLSEPFHPLSIASTGASTSYGATNSVSKSAPLIS